MSGSQAVVTTSKLDIGPCRVTFDDLDVGGTLDNVVVNFKFMKAPLKADQSGESLRDEAISGVEITIETSIAETRSNDLLKKIFPNATPIEDSPKKALQWENLIATRMLPNAKVLTLHPLVEADDSLNFDWTIYKAMPSEESSYSFSPTDQGKMKIVWKAYLDDSVTPNRMFRYGDPTVTP